MRARSTGPTAVCSLAPCCRCPTAARCSPIVDVVGRKAHGARADRAQRGAGGGRPAQVAFISHVSYELRTPLTNIIGLAELLASPAGPLADKQREYVNDIRPRGARSEPSSTIFSISPPSMPARSS